MFGLFPDISNTVSQAATRSLWVNFATVTTYFHVWVIIQTTTFKLMNLILDILLAQIVV